MARARRKQGLPVLWGVCRNISLSADNVGGLELLGKQRKEFIPRKKEEGRKAERTGMSESLGLG